MIPTIQYSRKGKTMKTVKRSAVARVGGREWMGRAQRIFRVVKTLARKTDMSSWGRQR